MAAGPTPTPSGLRAIAWLSKLGTGFESVRREAGSKTSRDRNPFFPLRSVLHLNPDFLSVRPDLRHVHGVAEDRKGMKIAGDLGA